MTKVAASTRSMERFRVDFEFHFHGRSGSDKVRDMLSKWAGIRKPSKLRGEHHNSTAFLNCCRTL